MLSKLICFTAIAYGITPVAATTIELFSGNECALSLGTLNPPSEQGCTDLNTDETISGAIATGMPDGCAIIFYSDESCNVAEFITQGSDQNGQCVENGVNNPGAITYIVDGYVNMAPSIRYQ
ncbi:hypothetical protein LTR85_003075 [Meristemomyces frigidus]|nr:hypothetical protein LTR85_003075 [Meristemomyces frigidus]